MASGDAELAVVAGDTEALRVVGLSSGNAGTGPDEIRFGLRLQHGRVEVRESGVYKAERAIASRDVLRVTVKAGRVSYSDNGTVFYASVTPPIYPLLVDTSLFDLGATLAGVTLAHP